MKSKLIILNGPSGVGKNTIAELYKNEHPTTVVIDIDEVRRTILDYRDHREESYKKACKLAFVEVEKYLEKGCDVIIPNKIKKLDVIDSFKKIAKKCKADFYEFVLWASKEDVMNRAVKRGFRPGSLLQENKLSDMYDELEQSLKDRKDVVVIHTKEGKAEDVYNQVIKSLQ